MGVIYYFIHWDEQYLSIVLNILNILFKMINYIVNVIKTVDRKILFNFLYKTKQKFLSLRSQLYISKIEYKFNLYYEKKASALSLLCDEHGCDKGYFNLSKRVFFRNLHPHTYVDFYSLLFDHCRNDIKKVFECGIGSNKINFPSSMGKDYTPGASLKIWRDYFQNAQIYGADLDSDILFQSERIKTFYVNQLEKRSIEKMWEQINSNNFDLIIDDGLHTLEAGITLFENSFKYLKKGGIYIIEDVDPSYLTDLSKHLESKNNVEIILLKSKNEKLLKDNNLIVIRN